MEIKRWGIKVHQPQRRTQGQEQHQVREPFGQPEKEGMISFEQRIVVNFWENREFAINRRIEYFTPSSMKSITRQGVANFGCIEVGQLPAEAFAEVGR